MASKRYDGNMSDKTTIYLEPTVKKFIKHKSVEQNTSMSDIINSYFADMLQDLDDIKTIKERRNEDTITFDELLSDLGLTYDDLRD